MSTAPLPTPYVHRPISTSAELSALLSPYLSELCRHSNIKPYLDVLNEVAADQQQWAAEFVQCVLHAMEQVSAALLSTSQRFTPPHAILLTSSPPPSPVCVRPL